MIKKLPNGKFQVVDEDGKSQGIYKTMAGAEMNDKEEEDENDEEVEMEFDDFTEEHVKLIEVLRNGTQEELNEMADEQEEELTKELKKRGKTMADIKNQEDD